MTEVESELHDINNGYKAYDTLVKKIKESHLLTEDEKKVLLNPQDDNLNKLRSFCEQIKPQMPLN